MTSASTIGRFLAAALAAVVWLATPASAQAFAFPAFSNYVVDAADVLPVGDEEALVAKLKRFQEATGHQFAIATVPSLEGTSVEDYGNRLYREWKLGDATRNDGALLLIAPNERKVRIEVGYGLEGDLTDLVAAMIIQNSILPRFKAGDMPGGIARGADDVVAVFSGEAEAYKERALKAMTEPEPAPLWAQVVAIALFVLGMGFILLMFYLFFRSLFTTGTRGRGGRWITTGGGGFGGGSWSGGGGGGFGGGGGGSSGGGGASGGW